MKRTLAEMIQSGKAKLKRFLQRRLPGPPEDPYSYVGAPKKPRPPHRSAAAAEPLD